MFEELMDQLNDNPTVFVLGLGAFLILGPFIALFLLIYGLVVAVLELCSPGSTGW